MSAAQCFCIYPEGKLKEDDEGRLVMLVDVHKGKVMIEFGTEVKWFAMSKTQAMQLGKLLIEKAGYTCRIGKS